jgi:hypothetical protein
MSLPGKQRYRPFCWWNPWRVGRDAPVPRPCPCRSFPAGDGPPRWCPLYVVGIDWGFDPPAMSMMRYPVARH